MPFFSQKKQPPPANGLASQSTQQPLPVCTWSAHAPQSGQSPSPLPRSYHTLTATATAAGELFLFGGYVHGAASGDLYVFSTRDFSTTLMQTSGEAPTPRFAHGAALFGTTTLLICGGKWKPGPEAQNVLNHDSLSLLDLVSREWTHVEVNGPGPGRRYCHTTAVVGPKLFVFGGQIGEKTVNDLWSLDLNSLSSQSCWELYGPTSGNEKPLPRSAHSSVTTEGRIIIFGGVSGQHFYNDTWSFDISTRKWTELQCTGSIPSRRAGHAAVLVDDVMYVFSGYVDLRKTNSGGLYALQLSTQRWFNCHNVGPSPHLRAFHSTASDGTRVFVLGGNSPNAREDEVSLIHVFDTKYIKYPEPEPNAVHPHEKTTQLAWKSSASPRTLEQSQHSTSPSLEAHDASRLQNATPTVSGHPTSLQITHERNPGPHLSTNNKPRRVQEDDVREVSTGHHAEFTTPHSSSEGDATRLDLERQLLAAQSERDQSIARLSDELTLKSALLEQAQANAAEAAKRAGLHADRLLVQTSLVEQRDTELADMQAKLRDTEAKLDELVLSRDQQVGQPERELAKVRAKLEAKESELETVRLRLTNAEKDLTKCKAEADKLRTQTATGSVVSRDQQVGQSEKELANMCAKLEAKESELEAVRLRLTDAEAEADKLRIQIATGSVNRDEDHVTRRLMERMRALEAEVASKRWNEKSIEDMECRNEG